MNVKEGITNVKTVEELDSLLVKYAKSNPEKYAIKLASGEFEKLRKTLIGNKVLKEEVKEEKHKPVK